jgi:hypothetical protein
MGDFIITAPDGKRYKVTGDSQEGALAALRKMLGGGQPQQMPSEKLIATTKDGGRVVETANGLSFTSPGYSTTNQEQIARIMEGATPADESVSSFDRQTIAQHPVASRAAKVVQGVPFVGEWTDEAVGMVSEPARDAMRASRSAMDRENPVESAALQIGGGIAGAIPMAVAAGPSFVARGASSLGQRMAQGAAAGLVLGGAEGAVSGAGAGDDGSRGGEALRRGAWGAGIGAGVGAVAPAIASGASALVRRLKQSDVRTIAREMGISNDAARVVKTAIQNDDLGAAEAAIQRAGGKAMLADAGQGTQTLLDASIATGGKAGRVARDAIEDRAAQSGRQMQSALDDVLGGAQGQQALSRAVRDGTAGARSTAYEAAYAAPIDYSSARGKTLESLLKRVPGSAIRRADELMRLEGVQSRQIMAQIADDGTVTYSSLPDVRQLDYITRALNDVADAADGAGKLGGTTQLGRATSGLSKNIRSTLRGAVPEYGVALDTAADAISEKNAIDLGYSMLRAGTTRETVREALKGASKAEVSAAKQGLRSYVDDTLANVRGFITSQNFDVNEFRKLVGDLSSRASREKMTALLGPKDAGNLFKTLDREIMSLELRAAVAANSKTAVRQAVQGAVSDQTAPGSLGLLMQGEPINATKRIVQVLTGQTPEAVALRQQGIYDEIAQALTQTRGNDAKVAIQVINRAIQGQPVTDAQARLVGRVLSGSLAVSAHQSGTRLLSTK